MLSRICPGEVVPAEDEKQATNSDAGKHQQDKDGQYYTCL